MGLDRHSDHADIQLGVPYLEVRLPRHEPTQADLILYFSPRNVPTATTAEFFLDTFCSVLCSSLLSYSLLSLLCYAFSALRSLTGTTCMIYIAVANQSGSVHVWDRFGLPLVQVSLLRVKATGESRIAANTLHTVHSL